MRLSCALALFSTVILAACSKSSPPPQKPLTPRSLTQIETSLRPLAL